ncbi:cut3 [Nucleospora cyclopteri]
MQINHNQSENLILEGINMINFKSYKGIYCIKPFNPHFTAIVGPNGSGKSNIIDSILFVLGYRAKKMRHTSLKDLIHKGESECSVELQFNKFYLKRELNNAGHSKYFYKLIKTENVSNIMYEDYKNMSNKEFSDFIKSNGIDTVHNRFLILQGEIESIALMNPMELLSYIEDCITTENYQEQIEKCLSSISSLQNQFDVLKDRFQFVENEYKFKKTRFEEKKTVLQAKETIFMINSKIVDLKTQATALEINQVQFDNEEISSTLGNLKEKIQKLQNKLETVNKENEDEFKEVEKQFYMEKEILMKKESENKKNEDLKIKLLSEISEGIKNNKKYEIQQEKVKNEKGELEKRLQINLNEIKRLNSSIEKHEEKLNTYKKKESGEEKRIRRNLMEKVDEREKIIKLINEKEFLESEISSKQIKLKELKDIKKTVTDEEIEAVRKDLIATEKELNKRKTRANDFKNSEIKYKKQQQVLEAVKNVEGFVGSLESLGTIETGFEIAVEAACNQMNSIVVETTRSAEKMIKIINERKLQRTTFIILDKIQVPGKTELNENLLLYKKISCNKKYEKCFYFALKNTLVVENIENAKKLAFGKIRHRVVTRDGKLLEKSGIMSGGKISKKVKPVAEIEQIYEKMKNHYDQLKLKYNLEMNKNKEIKKTASDLELQENQLKLLIEGEKEIFMGNCDFIKKLENEINNYEIELEKEEEKSKMPAEFAGLNQKIMELFKEKRERIKENRDIENKLNCGITLKRVKIDELEEKLERIEIQPINIEKFTIIEQKYKKCLEENSEYKKRRIDLMKLIEKNIQKEAELQEEEIEGKQKLLELEKIYKICRKKQKSLEIDFVKLQGLLQKYSGEAKRDKMEKYEEFNNLLKIKQESEKLQKELETVFKQHKSVNKEELAGHLDEEIEKLYEAVFNEFINIEEELKEKQIKKDSLNNKIEEEQKKADCLKNKRYTEFMEGYNKINRNLKEIFTLITFGGNAELDLINFLDPFSEGIQLSIMPPKKAWKIISNLSGGEKTLSSLALIFALHKFKPSSFYVMDEIDAALDFKNVSVISNYLKQVNSQFIVISLRNGMFEMADSLIGVYKVGNESKFILADIKKLEIK